VALIGIKISLAFSNHEEQISLIVFTFKCGFIKIGLLLCQPVASAAILYIMIKADLF